MSECCRPRTPYCHHGDCPRANDVVSARTGQDLTSLSWLDQLCPLASVSRQPTERGGYLAGFFRACHRSPVPARQVAAAAMALVTREARRVKADACIWPEARNVYDHPDATGDVPRPAASLLPGAAISRQQRTHSATVRDGLATDRITACNCSPCSTVEGAVRTKSNRRRHPQRVWWSVDAHQGGVGGQNSAITWTEAIGQADFYKGSRTESCPTNIQPACDHIGCPQRRRRH